MVKETTLREYTQGIEEFLRSARIDEAIAHSSHILTEYPKNVAAYRNLGRALMRQQRHEEAGELFRRLLGAVPDDFSAHYQLSIVYEQSNQADAALYHVERAFDQQPSNKQVNERLRALYKKFRNIDVSKIQLTAGAVAQQYIKGGNYAQAINLLKDTLKKMPDRVDLRLLLAQAYWDSEQKVKAAEECIALLKSSPYVLEANKIMTFFWLEQERPSDAQRFLSRIEELDPYAAFEIATGKKVPDEQFTLSELDFQKYAATLTSQQTPDWLESIEVSDDAPVEAAEEVGNWLDKVDESAKPPAPAKKKVTDSLEGLLPDDFDFPDSAGTDDTVSQEEEDELEALLGESGTGLTDLLGVDASDDEAFMDSLLSDIDAAKAPPVNRSSTGLTGMLRALGGKEEETPEEDDSWLNELASGRFDTGELGQKAESGDVDDFFAANVPDTNEFNPAAEIANEVDPMAWLGSNDDDEVSNFFTEVDDTGSLEAPAKAQTYDPNDPMAWLNASGIDFDEEAESPSFEMEDEPSEFISSEQDSMAWLGGMEEEAEDDRHLDTNEFSALAEEAKDEDPLGWLSAAGVEVENADEEIEKLVTDALSTGALGSEEAISTEAAMEWLEIEEEQSPEAYQSDEDVLAEMLDLASLTDEMPSVEASEDDLFSETDWQDSMDEQANFMPDDEMPEDEDSGMEWMNEPEEDPMAWLAGDDSPAEEEALEEDPMSWLSEAGVTIGEEESDVIAEGDTDFDLFGDEAVEELGDFDFSMEDESSDSGDFDFLADAEEESASPAPAVGGMTGMLNFLSSDAGNEELSGDWLSSLDEDDSLSEDLSWMNTLEGKENAEEEDFEGVSEFASDFELEKSTSEWATTQEDWGASGNEENFDWDTVEGTEEALDWTSTEESSDDFADFGEEEAEAADEGWLAELGDESADDFTDFGEEEVEAVGAEMDWMAELGDESTDDFADFGEEEAEPAAEGWMAELGDESADDFGDFGDEEVEPAAEGWLAELGDESADDFGDFGDEEVEPAAEGWLAELGDEQEDDFGDFGDEEAAPAEMDWMAELDEDAEDIDDFAEESPAPAMEWGEIPSTGFTEELEDAQAWGALPVTDDLEQGEEESAEMGWMTELDEEEIESEAETFEEEDDFVPQKSTFGMTGMLNSIRTTRGDEIEESLDVEEPDWLDHVDEELTMEEEAEAAPDYQPIASTAIDQIDWGDLVEEEEEEFVSFEEVEEEFEEVVVQEARPLAESFEEQEEEFFAEAAAALENDYNEELEPSHAVNAPDWLNAMVPGLDLDFTAEEDAQVEGDFAEAQTSLRERSISEEARSGNFGWLRDIVEEESGMMEALPEEDDYQQATPPPLWQRPRYRFSQPPLWARESNVASPEASASATPDYLSDFDDFDDTSDFDFDDDFDDDFSFEDDEFDK